MMYIANDQLRQACGGAGYTLASGIAQHVLSHSPLPTFEGVNVLMF
jgi:alkylation response protein AidB-like acyl-CoA dehydrogenase